MRKDELEAEVARLNNLLLEKNERIQDLTGDVKSANSGKVKLKQI